MPPKPAKSQEKSEADAAAVSKPELISILSDHRSALLTDLKSSFKELSEKLDGLQETVNSHDNRLTSLEENAESLHQRLEEVEASCDTLKSDNQRLKAKLTDLEGRNRRCNARLVGLPEGIEGPQPTKFFSLLLKEVLGEDVFASAPELDRAHRSLAPKPGHGDRPRPVLLCFHRFQNKELLIREARKRSTLQYQGRAFRVYEDYSPEVVNQRKAYKTVMASLYKMGLKPSLLYPARLRITQTDGTRTWLGSVAEADKFIQAFKDSS